MQDQDNMDIAFWKGHVMMAYERMCQYKNMKTYLGERTEEDFEKAARRLMNSDRPTMEHWYKALMVIDEEGLDYEEDAERHKDDFLALFDPRAVSKQQASFVGEI